MRLKLYRAATTQAAMAMIRAELGEEAFILSTRRAGGGVEIAAARGDDEPPPSPAIGPHLAHCLAYHGVPETAREGLMQGDLARALAGNFEFAPLSFAPDARPLLCAGPPGAGKTLTVARLATRLVMQGRKPMVITADGRRAGAVEQLAAFTRLLELDLIVASKPASLANALARRQEGAPVLIDLPGGSPFDAAQNDDIAAVAETVAARIAVVLPAGMDAAESAEYAAGYAALGGRFLIATRIDMARRLGGILAAAGAGLALAEAGIGAGAADGLAPMKPELLASLLRNAPTRGERLQ
jgi:flagellar biosynthesis protein FlhF